MAEQKTRPATVTVVKNGEAKHESPVKADAQAKKIESKSEKWKRLVNFRVPKLVKMLRQIANLSSKQTYDYTPEEAAKLLEYIHNEVSYINKRFTGPQPGPEVIKLF